MNVSWSFLGIHKPRIVMRHTPLDLVQFCSNCSTHQPITSLLAMSNPCVTTGSWAVFEANNGHKKITCFDNCQHPRGCLDPTQAYLSPCQVNPLLAELSWANKVVDFRMDVPWGDLCWPDVLGCSWRSLLEARCYAGVAQWRHSLGFHLEGFWGVMHVRPSASEQQHIIPSSPDGDLWLDWSRHSPQPGSTGNSSLEQHHLN